MLLNIKKNKSLIYEAVARTFATTINPKVKAPIKPATSDVTPKTTATPVNIFSLIKFILFSKAPKASTKANSGPPSKLPKKLLLGRPGNTLKMGIVGLANVGKSSTFNILSKLNVPAENYPFCTIDPNHAKVLVPDKRFEYLCKMWSPKGQLRATLDIIDIAGLVPGASEGQGLGNAFLSHIREVDGLYQVVRAFDDPRVAHTEGRVDPIKDMEIIRSEFIKKDTQVLEKKLHDVGKKSHDKNAKDEQLILPEEE